MRCPQCGRRTRVIDSRPVPKVNTIQRRRECIDRRCAHRFNTAEWVVAPTGKE